MRLLSIQEAASRRFERQSRIPALQIDAAGYCAHVGPISPGCRGCFEPDPFRMNINCGAACNAACDYCFDRGRAQAAQDAEVRLSVKAQVLRQARLPGYGPRAISFSGGGEPLCHLDRVSDYMRLFRGLEGRMVGAPWYYLYTNGLLATPDVLQRLADLGLCELRFHVGASGFAPDVFHHIAHAVRLLPVVTVETPAWPPHRASLFAMLPVLDDLGVKHLNLGEVEVSGDNRARIEAILPDAELYQWYQAHVYGGDLIYDLIEEIVVSGYRYSVLDCSGLVKGLQRSPAKRIVHEPLGAAVAGYDGVVTGSVTSADLSAVAAGGERRPAAVAARMDAVYARAHRCGVEMIDHVPVLLDPDGDPARGGTFALNGTARAIWESLDGVRTVAAIAGDLAKRFDAAEPVIRTDVAAFVGELLRRKMAVEQAGT